MKQRLSDPSETRRDAERQKGPIFLLVIFLCLGLLAAFLLFFVPAYWLHWKNS